MPARFARTVAAAAVALAATAAVPAATAAPATVLGGTTVVNAAGTSKARVWIPRATRVSLDVSRAVKIEGAGRLVGVILRENHDAPDEATFLRMPPQLRSQVYAWGPVEQPDCDESVPGHTDCTKAPIPKYMHLRRGGYTLYALTDGAPIRVTLRFEDLPGAVAVTPSTRVASGTSPMRTSFDQSVAWSAGTAVRTSGPADVFGAAWWTQDESEFANSGGCWYDDDGISELGQYRWVPGCPAGTSGSGSEIRNPLYGAWGPARGGLHGGLSTSATDAAETAGVGVWTIAENVRGGGGFVTWLAR